ncbi:uncharacterized protein LOC110979056 [Acanthaster planci]|uniref:Uncharacterized protein LOC110979056 n=1 Tax=Acanthaster planci TaxID=133434 RepID=A0A8B7YF12_ACAPL|nr:uncharacterized protein LOC110979056 [Acanthaster planci]
MGHVIRRLNRRFRELKRKTEKGEHTRVADGNNASSSGNFPNVLWSQIAAHDLEERNVEYETTIGPSGSAVEAGSPIYFDADDKETDRRDYGSRSNPGNSKTQGCAETMDNIEHTYFMRDLDD